MTKRLKQLVLTSFFIAGILSDQSNLLVAQDTIPFQLTSQGNISVQTIINNKDTCSLMLHTAVTEASLTEEAALQIFDSQSGQYATSQSWGGQNQIKYILNNSLSIGPFSWDSLTIWVSKLSGPETQGKFGPNLFEDQVIEINYDESILIIHSSMPQDNVTSSYSKLTYESDRGIMYIKGNLNIGGVYISNQFMVHTGYGGTILLDDNFVSKNAISTQLKVISESQLKDAAGNIIKTKKALLSEFDIQGIKFFNIPVSFFEGRLGNESTSVIGNELLKRFNIILDQKNATIYLKPNNNMTLPFASGK